MRTSKRLSIAVIALTTSAVVLQGARAAHAVDQPADLPANPSSSSRSAPEVMADVNDALRRVDAKPAVEEGAGRGGAGTRRTDLPGSAGPAIMSDGTASLALDGPAEGEDLAPSDDTTSLFKGTGTDTSVALQATEGGVRSLIHIDSPAAPERFEFPLGGDVTSLRLTPDGGAEALAADGKVIALASAPWAVDAVGNSVPTHYEVDGSTLVQIVEHRGGDFTYGIVADPALWDVAKCVAAITWVVGSTVFAAAKITKIKGAIKALGGIKEAAKLLVGATTWSEKLRTLGAAGAGAAAYFLGIDTIVNNC